MRVLGCLARHHFNFCLKKYVICFSLSFSTLLILKSTASNNEILFLSDTFYKFLVLNDMLYVRYQEISDENVK